MEIKHKFEIADLGKAPFKVISCYMDVGPHTSVINGVRCEIGAPGQPMGSCDYCGQGIKYCFRIQGSDGETFVVGSKCVEKTNDKGSPVYTAVEREMRRFKREARHANEKKKVQELSALLAEGAVRDLLRAIPHPNKYYATELKKTLSDYADWAVVHGGTSSKIKLLRRIKNLPSSSPSPKPETKHTQQRRKRQ